MEEGLSLYTLVFVGLCSSVQEVAFASPCLVHALKTVRAHMCTLL